jgi:hypothetical protein
VKVGDSFTVSRVGLDTRPGRTYKVVETSTEFSAPYVVFNDDAGDLRCWGRGSLESNGVCVVTPSVRRPPRSGRLMT